MDGRTNKSPTLIPQRLAVSVKFFLDMALQLKGLLEPFGLTRFSTDHWGAYTRHLDPDVHSPGKRNTQKIGDVSYSS